MSHSRLHLCEKKQAGQHSKAEPAEGAESGAAESSEPQFGPGSGQLETHSNYHKLHLQGSHNRKLCVALMPSAEGLASLGGSTVKTDRNHKDGGGGAALLCFNMSFWEKKIPFS